MEQIWLLDKIILFLKTNSVSKLCPSFPNNDLSTTPRTPDTFRGTKNFNWIFFLIEIETNIHK